MNITGFVQTKIAAKTLAVFTIFSMILSAAPVAFFVAEAGTDTLFTDSFESNPAFSSPSWTNDPQWGTSASAAYDGSKKAKTDGSQSGAALLTSETIDATGYESVELSFWYKQQGFESVSDDNDNVKVEWFDGSLWNLLETFVGESGDADDVNDWTQWTGPLGASADNNANIKLRFTSDLDAGNDKFFLDLVELTADKKVIIIPPAPKTEVEIDIYGDTSGGENQPGWLFNRDVTTATPFEFNTDEKVIGDGSLYVVPITNTYPVATKEGNDKFIAEYFWAGRIADLSEFTYDFLIGSGGDASDENEFYLNVYANFGESPVTNFYDCRYNIVPTVGSTDSFTTVTFDPNQSYPVTTRGSSPYTCPAVPADMDNDSPNSTIRVFAINMGDTSSNDTGLDGYFDNVVLEEDTTITTFDFEPTPLDDVDPEVTIKNDATLCEGGFSEVSFKLFDEGKIDKVIINGVEKDLTDNKWSDVNFVKPGVFGAVAGDNTMVVYDVAGNTTTVEFFLCDESDVEQCINLLTNGSFEEPVVNKNSLWQKFANVAGWVIEKVSDSTPTTLELHRDWSSNEAADGLQYVELDGDHSTKVSQSVTTIPGAIYELSWAFAPRHNIDATQNKLSVLVEGTEVATEGPLVGAANLASSDWIKSSYSFAAADASTNITFADAGPSNSFGTFLDDAQLCLVKEPEPEICEDDSLVGATTVDEVNQGDRRDGSAIVDVNRIDPTKALGTNDWVSGSGTNFFSLGFGGSITLEFDRYVLDVVGTDLKIYEGTNGNYPEEVAKVEVSQNGVDFEVAGTASSDNPSQITDIDFASTSFAWIKFVRLTDMTNLAIHSSDADGFDLDAVVATEVVCVPPYEPEEPKELPQCSQYFTEGIVITQEQVLLSHDEGGAFVGPQSVNIPAGHYNVNALSFDYHTDNLWDNLQFEQWFVNGLVNDVVVFTSEVTDDLPTDQNTIITELDRAVYFPNGLDALQWVHGAYPNGEYHSIHPLCLQFVPVEPEIVQCTIESSTNTVIVDNNDYAVLAYTHPNWIDSSVMPDAEWIWETYYSEDSGDLDNDITRTFIETFTVATPTAATLDIAADNAYMVYINGSLVLDRSLPTYSNNFQAHTYKQNVDVSSYIVNGDNELKVVATNKGVNNSNSMSNPAGVLFKLTMEIEEGQQCEVTTEPEKEVDPNEFYDVISGFKYEVSSTSEVVIPKAGWTIYAYNSDTEELLTATTSESGAYTFIVEEGFWEVYEEIPEDWEQDSVYENGYEVIGEGQSELSCYFDIYEYGESEQLFSLVYLPEGNECNFYNEFIGSAEEPEEPEVVTTTSSSNSSSGTLVTNRATPTPSVAGASTSFCPFINDYMQIGIENDSWEVTKLQLFLNIFVGPTPITRIFDSTTDANVKLFQKKYSSEVLVPWVTEGIVPNSEPTGFVYKLTRWKINDILCPGSEEYPSFEGEDLTKNVDLD